MEQEVQILRLQEAGPVKVEWIVRQKEEGALTNRAIAESMRVSPTWVKVMWRRYRELGRVPALMKPGRIRG